jgi:2-haloacid dehalogenase
VLPKLIVLDVNETLSDLSPLASAFTRVGLAGSDVEAYFAGVLRDGFALACGAENPDFMEIASESLRLRLLPVVGSDGEVQRAVDEVMSTFRACDVHPDVEPGLRALRDAGVRLVTLSNSASSVAEELLARAGVADLVERTISSMNARAWKPHASAYVEMLEECGVRAADAMLVAVHPWDINGAARVGLRTGWVDRGGMRYPPYFRAPDVTASGLDTLAAALA